MEGKRLMILPHDQVISFPPAGSSHSPPPPLSLGSSTLLLLLQLHHWHYKVRGHSIRTFSRFTLYKVPVWKQYKKGDPELHPVFWIRGYLF
jgi:hypothetical protein